MHTKKAILVRIILRQRSFFYFLKKLKEIRNMKKKDEIFILSELLLFLGINKLIFLYFLTSRQPAAIVKTKVEVFIKNFDRKTIDVAINRK